MRGRLPTLALLWTLLPLAPLDAQESKTFAVLAVNDVYRIEGISDGGGLARLATVRSDLEERYPDLLVLHGGDLLYPSLMSRIYGGEQMVNALNALDGDPVRFDDRLFVTFGNHEFDANDAEDVPGLADRIRESQFTWLRSGIDFSELVSYQVGSGDDARSIHLDGIGRHVLPNLRGRSLLSAGGAWVGIFGITLPVDGVDYIDRFVLTHGERREYVRRRTAELRRAGADFVIALTHLSLPADSLLLHELGPDGPDLIVGGHDHGASITRVKGRYVVKADADARTANLIEITLTDTDFPEVVVTPQDIDRSVAEDSELRDVVEGWVERHNRDYCSGLGLDDDCLDEELARLDGDLVAEELEIRGDETAFGQWAAEISLAAVTAAGGQPVAAFLNSGALRLNQTLTDGTPFTRRHLEELIQYPGPIHEIAVTGRELESMMETSARCIGSGPWLQFTGITAGIDRASRQVSDIRVGGAPLDAGATYRIVVPDFMAGGGDGYGVLAGKERLTTVGNIKDVVVDALDALSGGRLVLRLSPLLSATTLPGGPADPCPNP